MFMNMREKVIEANKVNWENCMSTKSPYRIAQKDATYSLFWRTKILKTNT